MPEPKKCRTCNGEGTVVAVYSYKGVTKGFSPDAPCPECRSPNTIVHKEDHTITVNK